MNLYHIKDSLEGDLFIISPLDQASIQGRINVLRQEIGASWKEEVIINLLVAGGNMYVVRIHDAYNPPLHGYVHFDPAKSIACGDPVELAERAVEAAKVRDAVVSLIHNQANKVEPLNLSIVKSKVDSGLILKEIKDAPIPLTIKKPTLVDKIRSMLKPIA